MATLIVNADDFGIHSYVNSAIAACVDFGSINSVSVIANGTSPEFELLKRFFEKGIFIGAHITWVGEPWISEPLFFSDWKSLLRQLITGGKSFRTKLYHEAEAQIQRLVAAGITPEHIDSHQHLHHFPGLWQITTGLQQKYGIGRIRTARARNYALQRKTFSGFVLNLLATGKFGENGFYCAGVALSGNYNNSLFDTELDMMQGYNIELIVHPGLNNKELNKRYASWHFNWEQEFAALMSDDFIKAINKHQYNLLRK